MVEVQPENTCILRPNGEMPPMRKPLRGEFVAGNSKSLPKFIINENGPHVMMADSFARGKGGFFWANDRHNEIQGLMEVKSLFNSRWFSPWHDGTGIDSIVFTLEDAQKIQEAERLRTAKCRGGCVHWLPKMESCSVAGDVSSCRSFFKK